MKACWLAVALAVLSSGAQAGDAWTCSNADLGKVTCSSAGCDVFPPGDFVSMTVAIDGYDGFDVCTEEGCWSGPGMRQSAGRYEMIIGLDMPWSQGGAIGPNDAVLTFERSTGLGTITAPPHYGPIHCMEHPGE